MNKVHFVYYDLEENLSEESLWAEPVGKYFRIKNIPFFAPNVALEDIISVEIDGEILYFDELVEPSGYSTVQIVIIKDEHKQAIIDAVEGFGCAWEGIHDQSYLAVSVPVAVNYKVFKCFLHTQQELSALDYNESCLSEKHHSETEQ